MCACVKDITCTRATKEFHFCCAWGCRKTGSVVVGRSASMSSLPTFTEEEVASHNTSESLWVSIEGKVYDITAFQDSHPGGRDVLLDNAGKDATSAFAGVGHSDDAVNMREGHYLIGTLEGYVAESAETEPPATTTKPQPPVPPATESLASSDSTTATTSRVGASASSTSCCHGQPAARMAAVVVGVAAVCIGVYFAYKKFKK